MQLFLAKYNSLLSKELVSFKLHLEANSKKRGKLRGIIAQNVQIIRHNFGEEDLKFIVHCEEE